MRVKVNKPRRYGPVNQNVLPKSPQKKQLAGEFHSDETTDTNGDSKSFELANEEFPVLSSICHNSTSEAQGFVPLTNISEQARNSSSSKLNIEFGTYRSSESLTSLSLPTKDGNEDSGISSSEGTMLVVTRVAMERKEEFRGSDEKRD